MSIKRKFCKASLILTGLLVIQTGLYGQEAKHPKYYEIISVEKVDDNNADPDSKVIEVKLNATMINRDGYGKFLLPISGQEEFAFAKFMVIPEKGNAYEPKVTDRLSIAVLNDVVAELKRKPQKIRLYVRKIVEIKPGSDRD